MVIRAEPDPKLLASEVTFSCPVAELGGTLLLPDARGKVPCVVIVGGSLSSTRDGALARKDAPPRDALKRLAEALARGGVASLRYDKVGQGASKPTNKMTGSYADEAAIAAAAIEYARSRPEIGKVFVAGESAGGRVALLRRREELKHPPDEMFKHIQAPALALAGEKDLNVPTGHAARAVAILKSAGKRAAESVVIPGVDHSFQTAPDDPAQATRERHDFSSFRRAYDPKLYETILAWLKKQ
jgi:fermentation-respiration switch protein FrsA (DUF1100 family)